MTKQNINKRLTKSIIKVVACLSLTFALVVVIYGINRMNDRLDEQLEYISKLGQTSLRGAIWNLDNEGVNEILSAIFIDNDIAYLAVVTGEKVSAEKIKPGFGNKEFSFFVSSSRFV
ncbi:MAG: hypothetical protein R8K20_09965, partial [Gallionellaceae bacterium]